jgi:hypothetical protein
LSGSRLSYLRIVEVRRRLPESQVRRLLRGIEDISKLEYLHVCDEEPDIFPAKFIEHAPLKHLRLWPRKSPASCKPQQYTKLGLRTEILEKSALENLVLGLNRDWHTPEIKALGKYLPRLKHLWLDLLTFMPETCINPYCDNANQDSWTCSPFLGALRWHATDDMMSVSRNTGACSRQPPTLFLRGLDNPELEILKIQFRGQLPETCFSVS